MKPLQLSLKSSPVQRLDLSPLVPHVIAGKNLADIAALEIGTTRDKLTVGDVFKLKGAASDEIIIEGGSDRFDCVGQGMKGGVLRINGDVGMNAGRLLEGGTLVIAGSAGHYAGSRMKGGRLEILGHAGDFIGGPREGEIHGMEGGLLIVRGSAGHRAADRLRRGTIIVEGDAGDWPASRIVAGTLVVAGQSGINPGYLMRRGTLVLGHASPLPPTFIDCGPLNSAFASVFSRALKTDSRLGSRLFATPLRRVMGDMAVLGKGEILVPV
ncbi:formylmethanofuran dehydrogenase subunit C [Methyloferula stellata]|uniref:formylmethanofuran dehydrogenase subunit C n=1 Tax=Methyloferula stellata TaxID=876270 RepID=UPI000376A231|nr:formylmethanofuran dehydrogenase subunit C [Methyloferula stellata]